MARAESDTEPLASMFQPLGAPGSINEASRNSPPALRLTWAFGPDASTRVMSMPCADAKLTPDWLSTTALACIDNAPVATAT